MKNNWDRLQDYFNIVTTKESKDGKPLKRELTNHELSDAFVKLYIEVSKMKRENTQLRNNIRAMDGHPVIQINDPNAKLDDISLYLYLKDFWPSIFEDYKAKIQSSKILKGKRFKSFKEANNYVWKDLIQNNKLKKTNESLFVLSKWVDGMGIKHNFRNKQEFVTACLCYMDYKGYLDKEGKTFNKLGDIKRGSFRFNSDEETYAILTDTFDTVGKYKSGIEKFKLKIKELKEND